MAERAQKLSLFDPAIVRRAMRDSVIKLHPRTLMRNPVMFVVEVVAAVTTILFIRDLFGGTESPAFVGQIAAWLWFTVLFANFAEAMAEGRGKAQADALRRTKTQTMAKRLNDPESRDYELVPATSLERGDLVIVEVGDFIPGDGDVIEGIASVDESAITGESAPVIRESGGDRSAVTGGTRVLSDWIKVHITSNPGETFLDRMIALVEGAQRQKTPNEIALTILLVGMTIVFVLSTSTIEFFALYAGGPVSVVILIALLVTLIPDHHRWAPLGHRHRRHGSPGAVQRPGHVRPRRRGGWRRRYTAPRQDGHHYAGQPHGHRICAAGRGERRGARRRRPVGVAQR